MYKKTLISILIAFFVIADLAYARSWHFTGWVTDITIDSDSTFLVRENQTVDFTGTSGFLRRNIDLQNLKKISDVKVYDEKYKELKEDEVDIQYNTDKIRIKILKQISNEKKTWIFEYRVYGGIIFFKDYSELKWDVVSPERQVSIDKIEAYVNLPIEVPKNKITQKIIIEEDKKSKSENFNVLSTTTMKFWGEKIEPYKNFTIVVDLPKGIFAEEQKKKIIHYLWILIPLFTFVTLFWKWWINSRDPIIKKRIIPHYQPPDNISPAGLYALAYGKPSPNGIIATLVDLANRGYLKVIERDKKGVALPNKTYVLKKQEDYDENLGLKEHERLILRHLFATKESVSVDQLKDSIRSNVSRINRVIWNELIRGEYITKNPKDAKKRYIIKGTSVFVIGLVLMAVSSIACASFILTGLMIAGFGRYIPFETFKGKDVRWQALGFKKYMIDDCKLSSKAYLEPDTFVDYLSYAIIFGLEREWGNCYVNVKRFPPEWFVPANNWTTISILNFIKVFESVTSEQSSKR
jgi:hypothetical protein